MLRPATPADAGAVSALVLSHLAVLRATPDGCVAQDFVATVSESAERAYLQNGRYAFTVAELRSCMVGFIAVRDRSHVFHLFVDRAHWGRGVARALWCHALHSAVDPAALWTVNSSLPAQPVYRRFGFRDAGPRVDRHGVAFVPMVREPGMATL
jgi:GNAT superfamily N-acetyltransferase